MVFPTDVEIDDDLANRLSALLGELLESERQSIAGVDDARRNELRLFIEMREAELGDYEEVDTLFDKYIATLPEVERPQSGLQRSQLNVAWHQDLERELAVWKDELAELENRAVDKQAIFNSARDKAAYLLRRAAENAGLFPEGQNTSYAMQISGDRLVEQTGQSDAGQQNPIFLENPKRFQIRSQQGAFAECDVFNDGRELVIRSGSTAGNGHARWSLEAQRLQKKLIEEGILIDEGRLYRFEKDYKCSSASRVSIIVRGHATNAKRALKDANGVTFETCYPQ